MIHFVFMKNDVTIMLEVAQSSQSEIHILSDICVILVVYWVNLADMRWDGSILETITSCTDLG